MFTVNRKTDFLYGKLLKIIIFHSNFVCSLQVWNAIWWSRIKTPCVTDPVDPHPTGKICPKIVPGGKNSLKFQPNWKISRWFYLHWKLNGKITLHTHPKLNSWPGNNKFSIPIGTLIEISTPTEGTETGVCYQLLFYSSYTLSACW